MDNNLDNAPEEVLQDAEGQADEQAVNSQDDGGEKIAGKFKSVEELEKAYLEVEKVLTQTSQKAKKADELELTNKKLNALVGKIADEQGMTVDQVFNALNEEVGDVKPSADDKIAQLEKKIAERDLLDKYPEAKDNLDVIKAYAQANSLSLEDAIEAPSIKRIIEMSSKTAPSVVETTNKLSRNDAQRIDKIKKLRDGKLDNRDVGKLLLGSK